MKKTFKDLRKNKSLSQKQLALLLNVKRSTLSMWELKKSKPSIDIVEKIAKALAVSCEEILNCFN